MLIFKKLLSVVMLGSLVMSFNVNSSRAFDTENTKKSIIESNKKRVFWGLNSTKLLEAISFKRYDIAKKMISNGVRIRTTDCNGRSPLHYAARCGNLELVKLLVEKKVPVDCKDIYSQTPLMLSINEEVSDYLIEHGASLEFAEANRLDENGDSVLKLAVIENSIDEVESLIRHGADVNIIDKYSNTPLCFCSSVEMVELLIKNGASADLTTKKGIIPLLKAIRLHNSDFFKCLFEKSIVKGCVGENVMELVCCAVTHNCINVLKYFMNGPYFAFLNNHEVIEYIMYLSILNNADASLEYILSLGVDPNMILDDEDNTALHIAMKSKNILAIKILQKYGANWEVDNKEGLKPYQIIVSNSFFEELMKKNILGVA